MSEDSEANALLMSLNDFIKDVTCVAEENRGLRKKVSELEKKLEESHAAQRAMLERMSSPTASTEHPE